ncbi:hypothetical protein [Erythrobacter sp. THAF29]|uniref:hypothetical protein n=1 Tax=Erythrobacter sp. THAF29 TaxID=2587851 RepID=UPI00126930E5|nr:hypothetical protein [Erythrobacter sp. THAF29]QFT78875.1 hypothetical protein FIU90_15095 [Erythrobacter sp. THAF29]
MTNGSEKEIQIFNQWCEDFRSLQTVFWRVPFFAITITGGIGAAVIAFDGAVEIKRLLLAFAGLSNFVLIAIAWRVRQIMERLLIKTFAFEGLDKPKTGFFVLKCFSALFFIIGALLIYASLFFTGEMLSPKDSNSQLEESAKVIVIENQH